MRATWGWLSEHVDLSGWTPEEVARRLTLGGLEVEGIVRLDRGLEQVIVGRIVTAVAHPNADKLRVCEVDDGSSALRTIVCGAPNAAPGLLVPLALPGASLPNGATIAVSAVRGVSSAGMLCSARELGLADDHAGLLVLEPDAVPGTPLARVLGLDDVVFELSLTPNRADCLSIIGLAREISARLGCARRSPPARGGTVHRGGAAIDGEIQVEIRDDRCSRYAGVLARGVRVGPSPLWMRRRLEAVGQRPVNNIVDVTNYILFEFGQPLHGFDLDQVGGRRIEVRSAARGEGIETLDGQQRTLEGDELLICDGARPVAIAGVMGGANSEISPTTTSVFFECAHFDRMTVRRTAKRLGMRTESSYRFERGVDPNGFEPVLARTLELLAATQAALGHQCEVAPGAVDVVRRRVDPVSIDFALSMTRRVLGLEVSTDEVVRLLESLGLGVTPRGDRLLVTVPTFRPDLERPIDLVEEIGRLIGFDALPATLPAGIPGVPPIRRGDAPVPQQDQPIQAGERLDAIDAVRDAATRLGWHEAINWGLADPATTAALLGREASIWLRNPLSSEHSTMRHSLLGGLLGNVAHNLARGAERVALFEVGSVFEGEGLSDHREPLHLAAVATGTRSLDWSNQGAAFDAHDIVGLVEGVAPALRRRLTLHEAQSPPPWAHPAMVAEIRCEGRAVGVAARVHPGVLDRWDVKDHVFAVELSLDEVFAQPQAARRFSPIARMQDATRDVALLLDASLPFERVEAAIAGARHALVESVRLFDVYTGDRLEPGKRSLALRIVYRDPGATLTDGQVEAAHNAVVQTLTTELGAVVR